MIQQLHFWAFIPEKFSNLHAHKNMYTNVHSSFIHNSQEWKKLRCSSMIKLWHIQTTCDTWNTTQQLKRKELLLNINCNWNIF